MKTRITALILIFISTLSYGQWVDPSGNGTGAIHYQGGNVGIGTNTPANILDVRLSSVSGYSARFAETSGAGIIMGVNPYNNDALSGFIGHTSSNRNIRYNVNGTGKHLFCADGISQVVIDHQGKMGIGAHPLDNLHIINDNATIRLSSSTYYGVAGGALDSVLGTIKFSNRDDNHNYRAEIRGILTGNWAEFVGLSFTTNSGGNQVERMRITHAGNVGIGTNDPTHTLEVNGTIRAQEIKVEASPWPDYVFAEDYELSSLEETAAYIEENHHLPEIPSAAEIEANGVGLGEMNRLLLQKVEELTLHLIEMKAKNSELENRMTKLENQKR